MKYKDMKDKITFCQYGYKYIGDDIMVGDNKVGCLICGEPSEYIDIYSEAHFCSEECKDEFYNRFNELVNSDESNWEEDNE